MGWPASKQYKRDGYLNEFDLLIMAGFFYLSNPFRLLAGKAKDATRFYSAMAIHGTRIHAAFDHPRWLNCGYWKTARTPPEASADLARVLANAAELGPEDDILDLGFGFGDQDLLWNREYKVKKITGINITPVHVEFAKKRVAWAGLEDQIEFLVGSATDIPFEDERFTKVLALESAFHFDTREDFFREAYRTLVPGGKLAVLDMLPGVNPSGSALKRRLVKYIRSIGSIPEVNMYDRNRYGEILAEHGFVDIQLESVGDYVFSGFTQYLGGLMEGKIIEDLKEEDFVGERWVSHWRDTIGIEDYLLAVATKPL